MTKTKQGRLSPGLMIAVGAWVEMARTGKIKATGGKA